MKLEVNYKGSSPIARKVLIANARKLRGLGSTGIGSGEYMGHVAAVGEPTQLGSAFSDFFDGVAADAPDIGQSIADAGSGIAQGINSVLNIFRKPSTTTIQQVTPPTAQPAAESSQWIKGINNGVVIAGGVGVLALLVVGMRK